MAYGIDKRLLDKALAGDGPAMNSIVVALAPHVEKQLLRYPVAEEDRRDLLQSTLVQVVRRLGTFRGESNFSTWLFRVTANEALMMMRSQRRLRARITGGFELDDLSALATTADAEATQSDVMVENDRRDEQVRSALGELPEVYREVVVAHYHLALGLQEIAEQMKLSESAVRSRLHRARSRLRSILEATTIGQEAKEEGRAARSERAAA